VLVAAALVFIARPSTYRRPRQRPPTTRAWRSPLHSPPDSSQAGSEKVGAVQLAGRSMRYVQVLAADGRRCDISHFTE